MVKDHWDGERKEVFYLMMHSTHFIYVYTVKDHWNGEKEGSVLFNDNTEN